MKRAHPPSVAGSLPGEARAPAAVAAAGALVVQCSCAVAQAVETAAQTSRLRWHWCKTLPQNHRTMQVIPSTSGVPASPG